MHSVPRCRNYSKTATAMLGCFAKEAATLRHLCFDSSIARTAAMLLQQQADAARLGGRSYYIIAATLKQ